MDADFNNLERHENAKDAGRDGDYTEGRKGHEIRAARRQYCHDEGEKSPKGIIATTAPGMRGAFDSARARCTDHTYTIFGWSGQEEFWSHRKVFCSGFIAGGTARRSRTGFCRGDTIPIAERQAQEYARCRGIRRNWC
jgi:hypothetical protein